MGQDISQAFGLHLDRGKAGLTPNPPVWGGGQPVAGGWGQHSPQSSTRASR